MPTAGELFSRFRSVPHASGGADFAGLCARYPERASELRRLLAAARSDPKLPRRPLSDPAQADREGPTPAGGPVPTAGGRYEIQGEVARGGMGVIYAVRDRELNRQIAMKVIGTNVPGAEPFPLEDLPPAWVERFVEEAQITAQLDHPNIVPVHDLGIDAQGRIFFTMKLVRGQALNEVFARVRRRVDGWNLARGVSVLLRACEAVAHAHERGVVHRDLKPQNILVARLGEVYVMDWGLARPAHRADLYNLRPRAGFALGEAQGVWPPQVPGDPVTTTDSPLMTVDGTVLGTPAYMSPEHAGGRVEEITAASDVYALGAILYELLAGHPPYCGAGEGGSPKAVLAAVCAGPPAALKQVAGDAPPELAAICVKAMARGGADRYANAAALAEDLQAWLEGRVVRAYRTGALAELKAWILRNRLAAFSQAAGVSLLVVSLLAVIALQRQSGHRIERGHAALATSHRELQEALYAAATVNASFALDREDYATARAILERTDPALRHWEWAHLDLSLPNVHKLRAHPSPAGGCVGASFTIDSARMVSVGRDRTVNVWDTRRGERLSAWSLSEVPDVFALSPDARWVAVGSTNGALHLLELATGAVLWSVPAHQPRIQGLGFAPTLTSLVSVGEDGEVARWATADGQALARRTLDGPLRSVAVSPDGASVVVGSRAGPVRRLAFQTLGETDRWGEGYGGQLSVAFSPDGARVVTGGADGKVRVWSRGVATPVIEFPAHTAGAWRGLGPVPTNVWTVAFSPDGEYVASAGEDQVIKLWEARTGQEHATLTGHGSGYIPRLEFSPNGRWLLSIGDAAQGTLRLWNVHPDRRVTLLSGHEGRAWTAAFTPDSAHVISAGFDGVIRVARRSDGKVLRTFQGHTNAVVWSVAVTPDGRHLVSGGQDGTVRVWDMATGAQVRVIQAQVHPGRDLDITLQVALSPDGRRVVSGGYDGHVQVWELDTGVRLWGAQPDTNRIWSVAWSADGRQIAAGGDSGRLALWEADQGKARWSTNGTTALISTVAFSPDARQLLTAHLSGELRFWEVATGRLQRTIPAHPGFLRSAAFSPDGRRLVSAGADRMVRVWDTRLGEPVLSLPREPGTINGVAFSPDGKHLVSANDDGRVRVWHSEQP